MQGFSIGWHPPNQAEPLPQADERCSQRVRARLTCTCIGCMARWGVLVGYEMPGQSLPLLLCAGVDVSDWVCVTQHRVSPVTLHPATHELGRLVPSACPRSRERRVGRTIELGHHRAMQGTHRLGRVVTPGRTYVEAHNGMESVDEDERGPLECIGFASSSGRDTDGGELPPILVRVAAADDRAIEGGQ